MDDSNQEWEVRSLDDLDSQGLQLVANFFNEQFPGVFYPKCTPELFKWKLGASNPAGRGFLTVAICNGLVIGTTSGTRKALIQNGNILDAIEIGDTFTHPDFRKSGKCITPSSFTGTEEEYFSVSVFGRLVSETIGRAQKCGIKFVYGTPNENSKPPYIKRLSFTEIDIGKISSNLLVTSRYQPIQKIRFIQSIFEFITKAYTDMHSYLVLGKNTIHEISQDDFLSSMDNKYLENKVEIDKLYLLQNSQVLQHRYFMHPNYRYRYFQVTVNGANKGVLITSLILRPSGVRTAVVSDWFFSDRKIEKRRALFISKLRSHIHNAETISFWERDGYSRVTKLLLGILKHRKVSLIVKDLTGINNEKPHEFGRFPIGWSDNG
jgi:hypothetical protein